MMRRKDAFTLIEVLVSVMIVAILATIVSVNVIARLGRARVLAAKTQISELETGLDMYRLDNSRYPTQEQGLEALCIKPTRPPVPMHYDSEGYFKKKQIPLDPWGSEYIYLSPGSDGSLYEIISRGADGQPGGTGNDADISSLNIM